MHNAKLPVDRILPQAKRTIKKSVHCVCVCVYVLIVYGRPVNRTKWTVHDIRKKISNDRHDHMVSLNSFVIFLGGPIYI